MGRNQIIIYSLLAFFLVGMVFALVFYPRATDNGEGAANRVTTVIPVAHQFRNGVHTYLGDIQTPTPCHSIKGEASVKESYPEQVDIRLETKESSEICAQVIAVKKFRVSFHASEEAIIRAYLNGTPVLFEVTEVSGAVNLETLEI